MNRLIVPAAGFGLLTILSFTLIVVVVVRPWGGNDRGWKTHMNLTEEPFINYTRSEQAFVSAEGAAPILTWKTGAFIDPADAGSAHWVAHGCAGCHGLDGAGGVVGPNVLNKSAQDLSERARFGPKGMPAFGTSDLSDADIAALAEYVQKLTLAHPELVPTATPTPVVPTATPRPVVPTATAAPVGAPTPGPAATAAPGPTPAATAAQGGGDELVAAGRQLYNVTSGASGQGCAYCHGLEGSGGGEGSSNAPNIREASRSQIRSALANVYDMRDIKHTPEEIDALAAYIQHLREQ